MSEAFGMAAMAAFSLPGPRLPEATPSSGGAAHAVHGPAATPVMRRARVAGMDALLDPCGALYWAQQETLVVADLHLETGSSYARGGQMLPPYDSAVTLALLAEAVSRHRPRRILALGDSFHDPYGAERLGPSERAVLQRILAASEVVWITGNHDHDGAARLGGVATAALTIAGITFRHVPTPGRLAAREVAGHLHPAACVAVKGRTVKRRCFVGCARRLVMPAFGCLTGGLGLRDRAFGALWPQERPTLVHLLPPARPTRPPRPERG